MATTVAAPIRTIREQITSRIFLQLLPITDPDDFGDAVQDALVAEFRRNKSRIPKDSGLLQSILTDPKASKFKVRVRSGRIEIDVEHPGMLYVRSVAQRVKAAYDVNKVIKEATDALRRSRR